MRARWAVLAAGVITVLAAAEGAAHLTGVFAFFVQDINEPTASTKLLRQQLDSVQTRIDEVSPQVAQARASYDAHAEAAVRGIRFYDVYIGNAVGAMWAGAQDPIDVIASVELLQRRLSGDLKTVTELGQTYRDLNEKQATLRRLADLLRPYKDASDARADRLQKLPAGLVSPFAEPYVAYQIAEDWEALRANTFTLFFNWVARRISDEGAGVVLRPSDQPNTWELHEDVLNALAGDDIFPFIENARFYVRADHVTFTARIRKDNHTYHLLTVGQMERTGPASVQYRIEAIYMDGMPIDPRDPDVQREVYKGHLMEIDVASLLPAQNAGAVFEQHNGYLLFRAR
jgi:hypothetical protein